jgi:large subunit ribosomal protein L18
MSSTNPRRLGRLRRKKYVRKRITGSPVRPRLTVFRSAKHIYAQIIDDESGVTLVSASSLMPEIRDQVTGGNKDGARAVGKLLGERALAKGLSDVVFDRNGFRYHGRVAALADGAREAGLNF